MRIACLLLFALTTFSLGRGQNIYIPENGIVTLRSMVNGDYSQPNVIRLNSNDQIEFSFDELSHEYHRYTYRIEHHNADGSPSKISEREYLKGFNNLTIENVRPSVNTTVPYTHYSLTIPNEHQQLLCSGNYSICIFDEQNSRNPVAEVYFYVVDPLVSIEGSVSPDTDIDHNQGHQQLSLEIKHKGYEIKDVHRDLKVLIRQNNTCYNQVSSWNDARFIPSSIDNDIIKYAHCRALIFEAGNEYRHFETVSQKRPGINVQNLEFITPFRHATIHPDRLRIQNYLYAQDINGRYLVRDERVSNADTEADYFIVHFSLEAEETASATYYLEGELTNRELLPLQYDKENRSYVISMLLKQGHYNYHYLTKDENGNSSTNRTEGNFFQTENEYTIYVFHRAFGERYDRLVGVKKIQCGQ